MGGPDAAAMLALRQWDLGPAAVEPVSHSENIVYRVDLDDGQKFVLRMHRPGYHSYEGLVSEQLWTAALRKADIDVPVPRPTGAGNPYAEIAVNGETRFVGLLEWVNGTTMESLMASSGDDAQRVTQFSALGRLLARLHEQAGTWQPPAGFSRHALDAGGLMGETPFWGPFWRASSLSSQQQKYFSRLRSRIYTLLTDLPTESSDYSMIHADLHPGNVVVQGDRLHVIDFDDAAFGWHAYDFAVALKDYQEDRAFGTYQAALVQGYRMHRDLSDDTLALIPLFLLIRALNTIGWADARPELGYTDYISKLAGYVEARAETVLSTFD